MMEDRSTKTRRWSAKEDDVLRAAKSMDQALRDLPLRTERAIIQHCYNHNIEYPIWEDGRRHADTLRRRKPAEQTVRTRTSAEQQRDQTRSAAGGTSGRSVPGMPRFSWDTPERNLPVERVGKPGLD